MNYLRHQNYKNENTDAEFLNNIQKKKQNSKRKE